MADAPMPSALSAGFRCPISSRMETAEFTPDMPKVQRQVLDILVPHGNDTCADQNSGVIGEGKSGKG